MSVCVTYLFVYNEGKVKMSLFASIIKELISKRMLKFY